MHPFAIRFIDGTAFLVLSAILVVAAICGLFLQGTVWRRVVTLIAVVCGVGLLFTATPTPVTLQSGLWIALLAFALRGMRQLRNRALRIGVSGSLALLAAWMMCLELTHITARGIRTTGSQVYVVGDSLSAAIGRSDVPWPFLLEQYTKLKGTSLARAGASIEDGANQLGSLSLTGATVIVLLGGNDMITGVPAETYETSLRNLIQLIRARGGLPVLIEFPLFPFKEAYGRAFRRTANETGAAVIPKRVLADVLAKPGTTVDGLHLSAAGHEDLARRVGHLLVRQ